MRPMLQNFTDRLRALSPDEKDIAIGGAIQELASTVGEMAEAQRGILTKMEDLHKERVELANQRYAALADLINKRVRETEADIGKRFNKVDEHVVKTEKFQAEHQRILDDMQAHMKDDVSIDAWLGKHATAIIKAVLVFIGGAILAYTWKQVAGI